MIIWSCTIVLSFFVYSFLGWLWESTVCSLYNEKQLINRGFLVGPVMPDLRCRGIVLLFCTVSRAESGSCIRFVRSFVLCIGISCLVYDGKDVSHKVVGL